MKILFSILTIIFCSKLCAQEDRFKKSQIIDTIWVDQSLKESFAFYMPKSYDPKNPSPIIFIFEPLGRGNTGIKPFIKTAETYGYLLVCSNNSKNGPFERNYAISDRLFNKVFTSLKIDTERIYTSGFSGGGRLASSIAIKTDQVQGVVSCGAAFTINSGGLPTLQNFSYASIIGEQDMNYSELVFTKKYLRKADFSFEIFTHDIDHRWPTQDQILLAFDWMQLEAYKNLLLKVDQNSLLNIYERFYEQSRIHEKHNRLIATANEYERILENLNRYYDLDSIQKKLDILKENKTYKNQVKKNESLLDAELNLTNELLARFNKDMNKKSPNLGWWEDQIEKFNKNEQTDSRLESTMYNRLIKKLFAYAIETANYETNVNNVEQKIFCYDLCILIYPSYPFPYIKQIENSVLLNDSNLALDYLEKLIDSGYDKKDYLLKNKSIKSLENNERFEHVLSKINKT